jgi:hypothetical protein
MQKSIILSCLCVCGGLWFAAAVAAAAPAAERIPPGTPDQNAPSQFDSQAHTGDQNLSQRLDRSGGVIHPPGNVDPGMHITPPATGDKMPVVPAPGSPSGDPSVRPK